MRLSLVATLGVLGLVVSACGGPSGSHAASAGAGGTGAGSSVASAGSHGPSASGSNSSGSGAGNPAPAWSKATTGTCFAQEGTAVATNAKGDVFVAGDAFIIGTSCSVDFGGGTLPITSGEQPGFVVSYEPDGTYRWSVAFDDPNEPTAMIFPEKIAVAPNGSIAITGEVQGAKYDLFVAGVSPQGTLTYFHRVTGAIVTGASSTGIAATDDATYVCGSLVTDGLDFGCGDVSSAGPSQNLFVAKLHASDGTCVWSSSFGSNSADSVCTDLALDADSNVVAIGTFQGDLQLGTNALTAAASGSSFLANFTPGKTVSWAIAYGLSGAGALAGDRAGHLALAGEYETGDVAWSLPAIPSFGFSLYVAHCDDAQGHNLSAAGNLAVEPVAGHYRAALDDTGSTWVTKAAVYDTSIGTVQLPHIATKDMLLARFDGSNQPTFVKRFGSTDDQGGITPKGIAADPAGAAIVAGTMQGPVDFGQGAIGPSVSSGVVSMFVARVLPK